MDAVYPYTEVDPTGQKLTGANRYTVTFPRNTTPPVNGFWSITMYEIDEGWWLVPNALKQFRRRTHGVPSEERPSGAIGRRLCPAALDAGGECGNPAPTNFAGEMQFPDDPDELHVRLGSGCGGSSDRAMWTRVCAIVSASSTAADRLQRPRQPPDDGDADVPLLPRFDDRRPDARPPGIGVDEPLIGSLRLACSPVVHLKATTVPVAFRRQVVRDCRTSCPPCLE